MSLIIQLDKSITDKVIDKSGSIEPFEVQNQRQKFFNYLANLFKNQFKGVHFADSLINPIDERNSVFLNVINYEVVTKLAADQSPCARRDPPTTCYVLRTTFVTDLVYNGKSYGRRDKITNIYYSHDYPVEKLHDRYRGNIQMLMGYIHRETARDISSLNRELVPPPVYPEWLSKYDTLMDIGNLKMNGGVTLYSSEESALSLIGRPDTIIDYISEGGGAEHIKAYGYGEGSRLNYHERRGNKKEWYLSNFHISTPKIYFTLKGVTFRVGDKIEVIAEILPKSYANRRKAFTNKNGYKETGFVSIELPFYDSYMKQFTVDDMGGFYIGVDENGVIVSIGKGYRYT